MKSSIVWFRNDLRLDDNLALAAACKKGSSLVAVYVYDETSSSLGAASKWWLHHSLESLKKDLEELGMALILRKGNVSKELRKIVEEVNAEDLFFHRSYEPQDQKWSASLEHDLSSIGCAVHGFNGNLLFEPGQILNHSGNPYQVFTPFYKACLKEGVLEPISKPNIRNPYTKKLTSVALEDLDLLPKIPWDKGFYKVWEVGERAAVKKIKHFVLKKMEAYEIDRNFPSMEGTSRISPHLRFGEISPRRIWKIALESKAKSTEPYLRQLVWREFAYHLLYHFPQTVNKPLKEEFLKFEWSRSAKVLKKWQKGLTGYPIVDAAMKQLWSDGWMHNRLRMIVGSFLVKDLLISWTEGAKWFWDTLLDADLANNTLGWQWVAGCGADAAPYFRVFNPVLQGEKFDPEGEFVKKFLPQLSKLPAKWIHKPWKAPEEVLLEAGVVLGKDYPFPIVDHDEAKEIALKQYYSLKKRK